MNNEVEILKIGVILPYQFKKKQTILIVSDGGPIFDYYIQKLRNNYSDIYSFQKTSQSIVGYSNNPPLFGSKIKSLKGKPDDCPKIGEEFTIDGGRWQSQVVEKIIDKSIIITFSHVYAIHDISEIRNDKLKYLGI